MHSLQDGFGALSLTGVNYRPFTRSLPETMSVGRYVWEGLVGTQWSVTEFKMSPAFLLASCNLETYPSCVPFS